MCLRVRYVSLENIKLNERQKCVQVAFRRIADALDTSAKERKETTYMLKKKLRQREVEAEI